MHAAQQQQQASVSGQARRTRDRSRSWTWQIGSGFTPASTNAPPSPRDSSPERMEPERPPSAASSIRRRDRDDSHRPPRRRGTRSRANSSSSMNQDGTALTSGSGRGSRGSTRPSTPSSSAPPDLADADAMTPLYSGPLAIPPPRVRSSPHLGELQRLAHSFSPILHPSPPLVSPFDYSNAAAAVAAANAGYFGAAGFAAADDGARGDAHAASWLEIARANAAALSLHHAHATHSSSHLPLHDVPPPYSPPAPAAAPAFASQRTNTVTAPPSDDERDRSVRRSRSQHGAHNASEATPALRPSEPPDEADASGRRRRRAASHDGASLARLVGLTPSSAADQRQAPAVHTATFQQEQSESQLRQRRPTARPPFSDWDGLRSDGLTSGGEGLSDLNDSREASSSKGEDDDVFVLLILLQPLRLLAAVPGLLGTFWLLRNSVVLALQQQDLRRIGDRREPGPLDFLVSCLWSLGTAFYALSFTTLLLRRWLLYYSLLPSLIRLLALQAICWPLVRLTLYMFGPTQPVAAWVVIASTSAFSDIVARWVTSNIADVPLPRDDEASASDGLLRRGGRGLGKGSSILFKLIMGEPSNGAELDESEETDSQDQQDEDELLEEFRAADAALAELTRREQAHGAHHGGDGEVQPSAARSDRAIALTRARARAAARAVHARHQAKLNKQRLRAQRRRARARRHKMQITSRRVFHWDVAVRRNLIPLAIMSYATLWILLVDAM